MAGQPLDKIRPIKLGEITWDRRQAYEPRINTINRYFEENPTNQVDQVALLTRPALTRRTLVGTGPIRITYQQAGTFLDDMFVASGESFWRVHKSHGAADALTHITGTVNGTGAPSISATEDFVFVADGTDFKVFDPVVGNTLNLVTTPDDDPFISLAYIGGYTLCVRNNSQRVYWIEPGEKIVDPANFFEAERFPDWILQALPLGDQVALFGYKTSEFWYLSGEALAPFARLQGRLYDRGIWGGTAVKAGDPIILVGDDGVVYSVEGGPQRISYYGLEERIRRAMKIQAADVEE